MDIESSNFGLILSVQNQHNLSKLNVLNSAAARNEIYLISIFAYCTCKQELSKGYLDDKRIR